jgi:hypothetical protein
MGIYEELDGLVDLLIEKISEDDFLFQKNDILTMIKAFSLTEGFLWAVQDSRLLLDATNSAVIMLTKKIANKND